MKSTLRSSRLHVVAASLMLAFVWGCDGAPLVVSPDDAEVLRSTSGNPVVIVEVFDSKGQPLSGVLIRHWRANIGFGTLGTTDGSGQVTGALAPHSSYTIIAEYGRTQAQQAGIAVSSASDGATIATFQTDAATIKVENTNGVALSGVPVRYWQPNIGFRQVGNTGADGIAETELFAGTYTFLANLNRTQIQANVNITAGDPVDHTFVATAVNLRYSGTVRMHFPNVWTGVIPKQTNLFPGTYLFGFSGSGQPEKWVNLTVPSGENMIRTIAYLRVRDSNGQGIAGLSSRAHQEVFGYRNVPGTTDGNGVLLHIVDGVWGHDRLPGYFMIKERTGQFRGRQNPATNSFFTTFQTAQLRATVVSSGGQYSVANRQVQYHVPSGLSYPYLAGWGTVGATDASGVVAKELFPGTGYGSRVWHPSVNSPNYNLTAAGVDITITIP
jgi:hypothetical protein